MFSPQILQRNIAALTAAQGACPPLGALPGFLRVAITGNDVHVDLRISDSEQWQSVDGPSAATEAPAWLQQCDAPDATQLIVVGVGIGYLLQALATPRIRRIIALEPHPGLATLLLSQRDWRPWFDEGRLRLLTGPEYRGAANVARVLDGLLPIAVVTHGRRVTLESKVMAHAVQVAATIAQNARANGNTRKRFAGPYLLQTLENLPAIAAAADVAALDGQLAGIPALVVGAGPSLDANGPELRELQDRAVIISADTALRPLSLHGVRPALAVTVDSSALNARHVTAVDLEDVYLAAEGSVHPSSFAHFAGRTFAFRVSNHEPWPWFKAAGVDRGEVSTWGSVLTSAFTLARRIGCDPIIFAGADLAFTGMRPYCRGTIFDGMWQEWIDRGCTWEALMAEYFSRQPELWQDDINGQPTRTGPHLVSFRQWIVEQTNLAGRGTFINATGAGILHGGRIVQSTLSEALAGARRVDHVREVLRARHASATANHDAERAAQLLVNVREGRTPVPFARWRTFAADTVTEEQICQALDMLPGAVTADRHFAGVVAEKSHQNA